MRQVWKTACKQDQLYSFFPLIQRSDITITNNSRKIIKVFKDRFFPNPLNADLTNIQDIIYSTKIDIPAITDRELKNAILKQV